MSLEQSHGATGHGSAIGRAIMEEREIKAAAQWQAAKRQLKGLGAGCLFIAIAALCFLFYIAGRVAEMKIPTHVSTP